MFAGVRVRVTPPGSWGKKTCPASWSLWGSHPLGGLWGRAIRGGLGRVGSGLGTT